MEQKQLKTRSERLRLICLTSDLVRLAEDRARLGIAYGNSIYGSDEGRKIYDEMNELSREIRIIQKKIYD